VNPVLFLFATVAALLVLLCWAMRGSDRHKSRYSADTAALEENRRRHATYLPVIRQAMAANDVEFLATRASNGLLRRTNQERQRVAKLYLADLRDDFDRLLQLARVIAVLSPQVAASHEFEQLRLSLRFAWRYRLAVLGLYSAPRSLPQISNLSQMAGELAARMESAMQELGERAALAAEVASSLNRRRLDVA
jgi:hypothetical protein